MRFLSCLPGKTVVVTFIFWAALLVLVLAFAYIVAAWFYAKGLYREVLEVGPRLVEPGIWVRAVGRDRITLEAAGPRQDIGHPGTLGLVWRAGRARVGDVVDADTGRIVRTYSPVAGPPPPVCKGALADCEPVVLEGYVFVDPAEVGLEFSETIYQTPLGTQAAWLIPGHDQTRWAIHSHGWRAERREMVRLLRPFAADGRTSLVIDYRNDPGGPNDPSGRYRFGLSEWADLEAAVGHALDHGGAEDIVLTGCSTGAALVMRFLEESNLAGHVSGVVLDAPNIVLADTIRLGLTDTRGSRLIKETALVIADLRWGIDWDTTNYVGRARDILEVPTLVFHGTSDQTVPISGSRRLQAEVPELVELVETPAAGHVLSWNVDPERYEGYVARFLDHL